MSALPPKAEITERRRCMRFVPKSSLWFSASLVLGRRVRPRRIDRDAIAGGYNRNVGLDRLGGGDIGVAAGGVAFLQFRHAASVERVRVLGVLGDRGVVVGDGGVEGAELELNEAAAVERVAVIGPQPQRLVAVRQRAVEVLAVQGAPPAA